LPELERGLLADGDDDAVGLEQHFGALDGHGAPSAALVGGAELGALAPEQDPTTRTGDFVEVFGTLDESHARAEARRCMVCGTCGNCRACIDLFGCPAFGLQGGQVHIDPHICTACGMCAELCPNGAIVHVPATETASPTQS